MGVLRKVVPFAVNNGLRSKGNVVGPCARSARIATTILLANPAVKQQCLHCCVSAWRPFRPLLSCAPVAVVGWDRGAHSQDITKNIQYISNEKVKLTTDPVTLKIDKQSTRPLCVMINWLLARQKHVRKYATLYLEQGFDVLSVSCTPWQLMWPVKGSQLVAGDVLKFMTVNDTYSSLCVHGFSVAGYLWGEVCVHALKDPKTYQPVLDRVAAQVWDSAADISEISIGVPKAVFPKNQIMQKTLKTYMDDGPKLVPIGFRGVAIVTETDRRGWRDDLDAYQIEWQEHALDRDEWRKEAFAQQWNSNRLAKKPAKSVSDTPEIGFRSHYEKNKYHMKAFQHAATRHYIRSSQMFHTNPCRAPALFLLSKSDPVGAERSNRAVHDSWREMGTKCTWKCWDKSPHVQHYSHHPQEYLAALYQHLDKYGLVSQPEKMRVRL
ncbi:hypothetical protein MSG28_009110 [Choristoneura fumiferana]|uniref:Uncharacterized protein n=1 Tax=Choristoneura fumiferana TaxID=7141 RepID=A0ACC0KWD0_CHOFU|nr:hypothetical protein MSG28_009110 [Choristoneura fumiferana]